MTLTCSVIQGSYAEKSAHADAARQTVNAVLRDKRVKGFAEVLVAEDISTGLNHMYVT